MRFLPIFVPMLLLAAACGHEPSPQSAEGAPVVCDCGCGCEGECTCDDCGAGCCDGKPGHDQADKDGKDGGCDGGSCAPHSLKGGRPCAI